MLAKIIKGFAGVAAFGFAFYGITSLAVDTGLVKPKQHVEITTVSTSISDTIAHRTAVWDTTASDTAYLGSQLKDKGAWLVEFYGIALSYHPTGTAAIVRLKRVIFPEKREVWQDEGLIYIDPQGNIVAAQERSEKGRMWRCIQPIPGDAVSYDLWFKLPHSAILTKDPVACEKMFKDTHR